MGSRSPSQIPSWPVPFDPACELDWGDPIYSQRLLREHLDQNHDGASRRESVIDKHVVRLLRLLPPPPARVLDAACGPGLYACRLAALGYAVVGVDVSPACIAHARRTTPQLSVEFQEADLRAFTPDGGFAAILLIYHVLEAFPRRVQIAILRRLSAALGPGGTLIVEMRTRPDQGPGRLTGWEVVDQSLLGDEPHLLLSDTTWDDHTRTHILREVAIFDDGRTSIQQTTSMLTALEDLAPLYHQGGLVIDRCYDGWTRFRATSLSDGVLVIARRR